ncbi:small-conductance mechanosensitive channel [Microbacteriaceae bacterium SG_E_30_P1]|uniref:Small-conductance mechanosensitive channel n=1 Tax=Antiquaquibacter oligotrophicus TaxID=2880260 RepID=A0ABT6KRA0_9MICO|nr:mechanosensitive ion channel domain-containing protein [Antiquaquibacter oligotrophicus]MDH6182505.1 small-conductance mechanosensitive channel [Antiquaquibacter oligotrophicus]UDF14525.1 mechanosensitive ion channel family protein [Antiquaquibacter oligotrophicus]
MTVFDWTAALGVGITVAAAIAGAWIFGLIASGVVRLLGKDRSWRHLLITYTRLPFRVFVGVVLLWIGLTVVFADASFRPTISGAALVVFILALTWLATGFVRFGFTLADSRYDLGVADNRVARRVHTQLRVLRQVAVVVVWLIGVGAALLTFPAVQAFGASILASAGIVSLVAGIAAQSLLSNVFAGVQLALSDAIRVDDVVIAGGEWGRIEDITLTYVVVHIWDDRRLVLPSTYFTTTPFENWTRRDSALLGSVMLDVDWTISTTGLREELHRVLAETEQWDGRVGNVQVTSAEGGMIQVRVLVSAPDAGTLWDLRVAVRERLVEWVQRQRGGMPRTRVELVEPVTQKRRGAGAGASGDALFSGTPDAEARGDRFRSHDDEPKQ